MTQARQWGAGPVRRRCYPWRRDRLRGIGRMSASGSGRNGRRSPDRPCPEYGSVALQPRRGMLRPLLCCASDGQQGGNWRAGLQCRARRRKAHRYGREPLARSSGRLRGGNQGEIRIASPKSVPRELCRCLTRMFSNASRVVTIVFPHLVRVTEVAKPLASAPSIAP